MAIFKKTGQLQETLNSWFLEVVYCTHENPFSEVQSGVTVAFGEKHVYVNAFIDEYFENVTLSEGVGLLGIGTLIEGYNNQTFGSGIQPIINGDGEGPVVTVSGNNLIDGFHLINTSSVTAHRLLRVFPDGNFSEDLRQVGIWGNSVSSDIRIKNSPLRLLDMVFIWQLPEQQYL